MEQIARLKQDYILPRLEELGSYGDISGLKYAQAVRHMDLGGGVDDAEGNVVSLEIILAKQFLLTAKLPQDHFNIVHDALKDENPAILEKAIGLMVEYELLHHARVGIHKGASIDYKENLRSDVFYHDIPDHQIRELEPDEMEKKREDIAKIRYLRLIETAYVNVLRQLFHKEKDWPDFEDCNSDTSPGWRSAMEQYEENRAGKRLRLLSNPGELDLALEKEIIRLMG